jgi:hypothetical protein
MMPQQESILGYTPSDAKARDTGATCPRCKSDQIRPSTKWRLADIAQRGKIACRCRSCRNRFYLETAIMPAGRTKVVRRMGSPWKIWRNPNSRVLIRNVSILSTVLVAFALFLLLITSIGRAD